MASCGAPYNAGFGDQNGHNTGQATNISPTYANYAQGSHNTRQAASINPTYENYTQPNGSGSDDCVQIMRTTKRVTIPCTRNVTSNITVQVPRTVVDKIPEQVPYQTCEARSRVVPYTSHREEVRYGDQYQNYTEMVPKQRTTHVTVKRKVPKMVYVDEEVTIPKQETFFVPEVRQRKVRVPWKVQVPETRYRNETYHVPVTKYKTVTKEVPRTVYEPQTRQRCTQETKMVSVNLPDFYALPKAPPPFNDNAPYQGMVTTSNDANQNGRSRNLVTSNFNAQDSNTKHSRGEKFASSSFRHPSLEDGPETLLY